MFHLRLYSKLYSKSKILFYITKNISTNTSNNLLQTIVKMKQLPKISQNNILNIMNINSYFLHDGILFLFYCHCMILA